MRFISVVVLLTRAVSDRLWDCSHTPLLPLTFLSVILSQPISTALPSTLKAWQCKCQYMATSGFLVQSTNAQCTSHPMTLIHVDASNEVWTQKCWMFLCLGFCLTLKECIADITPAMSAKWLVTATAPAPAATFHTCFSHYTKPNFPQCHSASTLSSTSMPFCAAEVVRKTYRSRELSISVFCELRASVLIITIVYFSAFQQKLSLSKQKGTLLLLP